jgi:hypothetical protein
MPLVANLFLALDDILSNGYVDHVEIDGVPMVAGTGDTPGGHVDYHPTDPSKDVRGPHPGGHVHPADTYSFTLVPKP